MPTSPGGSMGRPGNRCMTANPERPVRRARIGRLGAARCLKGHTKVTPKSRAYWRRECVMLMSCDTACGAGGKVCRTGERAAAALAWRTTFRKMECRCLSGRRGKLNPVLGAARVCRAACGPASWWDGPARLWPRLPHTPGRFQPELRPACQC